jgi:hypothetical protein
LRRTRLTENITSDRQNLTRLLDKSCCNQAITRNIKGAHFCDRL